MPIRAPTQRQAYAIGLEVSAQIKILIIEDSKDLADLYRLALTQNALQVDLAEDGEEGYRIALSQDYGAIIVDVNLPFKDGITVTRDLRKNGYKGKIIAISGNDQKAMRDRCMSSGCDLFLSKLTPIQEITRIVEKLFRG